ncbi:MAG: hypothetical protein AAB351_00730 [Patescibacteria group bacterium]
MTTPSITSQTPVVPANDEQIGALKGLLDPILRRMSKPQAQAVFEAGGNLQERFGLVINQMVALLTNTFLVLINYGRNLADMIKAGNYRYVNENITEKNFPFTRKGEVSTEIVLVHFDREMESDVVLVELDKLGLRAAILPESLAFGETHPEEQRKFPIICLGSLWTSADGDRRVPYLDGWGGGRELNLDFFEDRWDGRCRFAAVRK